MKKIISLSRKRGSESKLEEPVRKCEKLEPLCLDSFDEDFLLFDCLKGSADYLDCDHGDDLSFGMAVLHWENLNNEIRASLNPEGFQLEMETIYRKVRDIIASNQSPGDQLARCHLGLMKVGLTYYVRLKERGKIGVGLACEVAKEAQVVEALHRDGIGGCLCVEHVEALAEVEKTVDRLKITDQDKKDGLLFSRVFALPYEQPEYFESKIDLTRENVAQLKSFFRQGEEFVVGLDLDGTCWEMDVENREMHYRSYFDQLVRYLGNLRSSGLNMRVGVWSHASEAVQNYLTSELINYVDFVIFREDSQKLSGLMTGRETGMPLKDLYAYQSAFMERYKKGVFKSPKDVLGVNARVLFFDDDSSNFEGVSPPYLCKVTPFVRAQKVGGRDLLSMMEYIDSILLTILRDPEKAHQKVESECDDSLEILFRENKIESWQDSLCGGNLEVNGAG